MPIIYELSLILRIMERPEIVAALKRTAECLYEKGAIIQKLENFGTMPLPFKIGVGGIRHKSGTYCLFELNCSPTIIDDILEETGRDVDIIRRNVFRQMKPIPHKCTLEKELLPPAYREEVQKMIAISKRKEKPSYHARSGLKLYPFQR